MGLAFPVALRVGESGFMFRYRLGLVAAAMLLAACTRVELEDHSFQFNQATGSLGNRVMLLNVVRAAKGYPTQFSKVTSYSGQSRMDGGLSLNIPFVGAVIGSPNSAFPGGVTPNASLKTGVSQLQLADLNTAETQKALRKPVTARDFAYYRSQGWPKALVNTILIEQLLVEPRLLAALKRAAASACATTRSRECRWLLSQATEKCLADAKEERASPDGDVVRVFSNNPRKRCQHESFQWVFTAIRVLPSASLDFEPKVDTDECRTPKALLKDIARSAKDGKGKSKDSDKGTSETVKDGKVSVEVNVKIADKADKDDSGDDKAKDSGSIAIVIPRNLAPRTDRPHPAFGDLDRLRNEHLCLLREGKTPIIISWRSPERMVRYLGDVLAAQAFGGARRGIEIFNEDGYPVELFRVEGGRGAAAGTAVSVEGPEGDAYFIPVPNRESKDAHLSLQALALVMESFNLAVSGKELPRAPTLFLSGG